MSAGPVLLALRPLGLGDLLTGVPAFRALARAFPEHRRVLATTSGVAPLARHLALFDQVVEAAPLQALPGAPEALDVAVNLHGRGPGSHRVLLERRPRRLIAFRHEDVPESHGLPSWRPEEHEVERWCRLLDECGVPANAGDLALEPPAATPGDGAHGATLIHPGAASPARRWPVARWAEVARAEAAAGRVVVVTGSAGERALGAEVARRAGLPARAALAGQTSVLELAVLVAVAGVVACGDTGVAHLATALGTPSLVLFGPTSPRSWGPPAERTRHRALWAGRTGNPHADVVDNGLLDIRTDEVIAQLADLRDQCATASVRGGER